MDYRVVWTPGADSNLEGIAEFIQRDSPYYASVVVSKIRSEARRLRKYPFRNRVVPEINDESVREVFVYEYRLIYEILDDTVIVMMIIHASRELLNVHNPRRN